MNSILDFFFKPKQPVPVPVPVLTVPTIERPCELILLDTQLESASEDHAKWAMKYYLQLILDGLPSTTAAKQTSFKFFGSYQSE